jgi:hypothetical protein
MNQFRLYLPWIAAVACGCLGVVARLLSNYYVKLRYREILIAGTIRGHVPRWVSTLYLTGFFGFIACGVWSFWIAWWAPLPLVVLYILSGLIPSGIIRVNQGASGPRRLCPTCCLLRPVTEFEADDNRPDGLRQSCILCDMKAAMSDNEGR